MFYWMTMKLSRFVFPAAALTLSIFVLCLGLSAIAATAPKPPPPVDARKLIKTVDVKNSSVTIQFMRDKTLHPYKIDGMTVLKLNNQDGKVADIKAGMVVDDFQERYSDTLDSLSLSGYGETPVAAKPKTPAKPKPKSATSTTPPVTQ